MANSCLYYSDSRLAKCCPGRPRAFPVVVVVQIAIRVIDEALVLRFVDMQQSGVLELREMMRLAESNLRFPQGSMPPQEEVCTSIHVFVYVQELQKLNLTLLA